MLRVSGERDNRCFKLFIDNKTIIIKLENVTTANALQLEAARATPRLSRINYNVMPSLKTLNLSIAVL